MITLAKIELVTPGSKRSATDAREILRRIGPNNTRDKSDGNETLTFLTPHMESMIVTVNSNCRHEGKWKCRRDGNQITPVPLTGIDGSQSQTSPSLSEPRDISPRAADGIALSRVRSTDQAMCQGPSIVAKLHCFLETLGMHTEDDSAAARLT
jgi:hypothetical protein